MKNETNTPAPDPNPTYHEPSTVIRANSRDSRANPAESPAPCKSRTPNASRRSSNGKVAALPKTLRDNVNHWLEDGLTYEQIIRKLGDAGKHLSQSNISQWKRRGHQKWLKDQFWQLDMRSRLESFTDFLVGLEPIKLPEAGLQVAATGICELLRQFCQATDQGTADPHQYVRVANSLARIARSVLVLQQYRDSHAKASAMNLPKLPADRDLAELEREAILDKADDIFGLKSYRRLIRQQASPGPGNQSPPAINPETEEHLMT